MTDTIQEADCTKVGIMLSGSGAEYPLWVLLGAPNPDLEIEWIVSGTPSENYRQDDFQPCAVICEKCPQEWEQFSGLPLLYQNGNFRLYHVDHQSPN
jgi:hypothetical protein